VGGWVGGWVGGHGLTEPSLLERLVLIPGHACNTNDWPGMHILSIYMSPITFAQSLCNILKTTYAVLGKNPIDTYISDRKKFGFYGKTNSSIPE
jgi:hypothetical protein